MPLIGSAGCGNFLRENTNVIENKLKLLSEGLTGKETLLRPWFTRENNIKINI
jgi:hypothetical protein